MPAGLESQERFNRIAQIMGYGDPAGGLWFVGLEEGSVWAPGIDGSDNDTIGEYFGRPSVRQDQYFYDCEDSPAVPKVNRFADNRSPISRWESKIASPLSSSIKDWREYQDQKLWYLGSKVFHSNLYPLGKKQLVDWPPHYKDLFGYGPDDHALYRDDVKKERFDWWRDFRAAMKPQAIVCFGKTGWDDFLELLEMDNAKPDPRPEKDIQIYSEQRIILSPFFGRFHMSNARAIRIGEVLQEWGISIP